MKKFSSAVKKKTHSNDRILRKPEVLMIAGVSHPTIWRWERAGLFPKRISLGPNSCGWIESEIVKWLDDKAVERTSIVQSQSEVE